MTAVQMEGTFPKGWNEWTPARRANYVRFEIEAIERNRKAERWSVVADYARNLAVIADALFDAQCESQSEGGNENASVG